MRGRYRPCFFSRIRRVACANVFESSWSQRIETLAFGFDLSKMTTSRRFADHKIAKFNKNVHKRGAVPETNIKKGSNYPVGPVVLGLFVFVVIGSALLQIMRTATSGGVA